jgi:molybdopterin synthase sulfur carrier subunit
VKVTVKYFASIREALGQGSETLETSASSVAALRDELIARGGVGAALNQAMSDEGAALAEGCEVAFFPPVTGG